MIKWDGHPVLVLEAAHMDFFTFLKRTHGAEVCRSFLKSACAACAHVHARSIIHCDIKPDNFLLQTCDGRGDIEGYRLVLADFGEALTAAKTSRELKSRSDVQRQSDISSGSCVLAFVGAVIVLCALVVRVVVVIVIVVVVEGR